MERSPPGVTLASSPCSLAPWGCCCSLLPLQDGPYPSSLQAIKRHEFTGLLEQPGTADLSNRVDYSALRCGAVVGRWGEPGSTP